MHRREVPGTGVQAAVANDHDRLVPALHVEKPQGTAPRFGAAGQTWRSRSGQLVAYGGRDHRCCWMTWPQLATYLFSLDKPQITAHPDPDAPLDVVWDTYRRSVLPMAMQARGWEALHASGVLSRRGVVAFCAVSETGKSSVAYGLARRGFAQWADDAVVLSTSAGSTISVPLPFQVRLRDSARSIFEGALPLPQRFMGNGPGAQRHAEASGVHTICVLERESRSGGPVVERMEPAAALRGLLTHAHEFDPTDPARRARMLETYLAVIASVPVYRVAFDAAAGSMSSLLDAIVNTLDLVAGAAHPAD